MILRLFRSNQPELGLLLPVIGLALWLPAWWLNQPADFSMALLSFGPLNQPWPDIWGILIGFGLVVLGALLFNNLFQRYELIGRKNQLPGLCYVIAFSWSPFLLQYSHILIAQIFVLLVIRRIMLIYRQPNVVRELFDVGLFLGLAGLFYTPAILYLLGCWASLGVLRPFSLREYLMPVTGVLCIGGLFFGLNFIFEWEAVASLEQTWYPIERVFPVGIFDWFKYLIAGILLLMTVVAMPSFMSALTRSTKRDRNLKMILLVFGVNTVALYFLFLLMPEFGSNVMLLAFPVALMLVYAVADKRVNWMISGLFYALLLSALINNYGMWLMH